MLVLQLTRAGFLALLWLFVLAVLRVVRSDLYAASGLRVAVPGFRRGQGKKGRGKAARQLVVTHGALAGTRISLDGRPILIGRADDSTLVLDDDYASTRHARVALRGTDWRLSDRNVWTVQRALIAMPHRRLSSSDARYDRWHRRYVEYRRQFPDRKPVYYTRKERWL